MKFDDSFRLFVWRRNAAGDVQADRCNDFGREDWQRSLVHRRRRPQDENDHGRHRRAFAAGRCGEAAAERNVGAGAFVCVRRQGVRPEERACVLPSNSQQQAESSCKFSFSFVRRSRELNVGYLLFQAALKAAVAGKNIEKATKDDEEEEEDEEAADDRGDLTVIEQLLAAAAFDVDVVLLLKVFPTSLACCRSFVCFQCVGL